MARKKVEKVGESVEVGLYSKLEEYSIWLYEYYNSLTKAGFDDPSAMAIMMDKDSYPDWVPFKTITKLDVTKHIEDED